MQAIRVHRFGDLDALVTEDVPRPFLATARYCCA